MSKRVIGHLVADIQQCKSSDDAVTKHKEEATGRNLSTAWIEAVFRNNRPLPVLDTSFDVHGKGVDVLHSMGVPQAVQTHMWGEWALLAEDVRAAWVADFKKLDFTDPQDVITFTQLLIDLLSEQEN